MSSSDELNKKLDQAWQKMLPLMLQRLEVINRGQRAMADGAVTEALKSEAAQEAHKLAGSLGVFGLQRGSESALKIERIFLSCDVPSGGQFSDLKELLQQLTHDIKSR